VAVERKHSGGAQVVRNGPSSPLCSDPQVFVLLFFPKVFPLCFVLLASVFSVPSLCSVLLPSLSLPFSLSLKFCPPLVFFVFNYSKHPTLFCLLSFLFSFFPSLFSVFISAQREGHLTSATEQGKVATLPLSWRRVGVEHGCP